MCAWRLGWTSIRWLSHRYISIWIRKKLARPSVCFMRWLIDPLIWSIMHMDFSKNLLGNRYCLKINFVDCSSVNIVDNKWYFALVERRRLIFYRLRFHTHLLEWIGFVFWPQFHRRLFLSAQLSITQLCLTHKNLETHDCVFRTVATDALVLKYQAISTHSAD